MNSDIQDLILDALEDADAVLDLDPQAVATVEPSAFAVRWGAIRDATLDARLPISDARAMLLAGMA